MSESNNGGKRPQLGALLLEAGALDQPRLEAALLEQRSGSMGLRLGSILLAQGVGAEPLLFALSKQLGVPAVDLARTAVPYGVLTGFFGRVERRDRVFPLRDEGETLFVAVSTPGDQRLLDEIAFLTGKKVRPFVAIDQVLRTTLAGLGGAELASDGFHLGALAGYPHDPLGYFHVIAPRVAPLAVTQPEVPRDLEFEPEHLRSAWDDQTTPGTEIPPELRDPPEPAREQPESKDRKRTVLIVEDDADIQRIMKSAMALDGYRVVTASNGREGLARIRSDSPDVIVLDAMLPAVHGFEICKKVKSSTRFARTPVIMVTAIYRGWRFAADIKAAYGADEVMEKPFDVNDLRHRVAQLLANAEGGSSPNDVTERAKELMDTGLRHLRAKDYDQAYGAFRQAAELEPFFYQSPYMLAVTLQAKGDLFQAIHQYERAIELKPTFFPAFRNLAELYEQTGFRNKALEMWERAALHSPDPETRRQMRERAGLSGP